MHDDDEYLDNPLDDLDDDPAADVYPIQAYRRDDVDSVPCPRCKRLIYDDAEQCPYCRHHLADDELVGPRYNWFMILGIALMLLAAAAFVIVATLSPPQGKY